MSPACPGALAIAQRRGEIAARRVQGGGCAEQQARRDRDYCGKGEHPRIQPDVCKARDVRFAQREQRVCQPDGQEQSECAASQTEESGLSEQLTHEARASSAERSADGHLALSRGGSREQQVGHVGQGDEQQDANGGEQEIQRRARVADERVGHRQHLEIPILRAAVLPQDFARHGFEVGASRGDVGVQAGNAGQVEGPAPRRHADREIAPEIDVGPRKHEARRRHADNRACLIVQTKRAAEHTPVRPEPRSPVRMRQHDEPSCTRCIFSVRKEPSQVRRHPQRGEKVARDARGPDDLGTPGSGQVERGVGKDRDVIECGMIRAPRQEIGVRQRKNPSLHAGDPDERNRLGVAEGQRPQQHSIHHCEHRRRRADAEGERGERDRHETGLQPERSERQPDVLPHSVHGCPPYAQLTVGRTAASCG